MKKAGAKVIFCDGVIEMNDGKTTTFSTSALTMPDGTVYISNGLKKSGEETAAHEIVHIKMILGDVSYAEFEGVIAENLDRKSAQYDELARTIAAEIIDKQASEDEIKEHGGRKAYIEEKINDLDFGKLFLQEITAAVNQFCSTDMDTANRLFEGLFTDWNAVAEASRQFNKDIGADFSESASFMPEGVDAEINYTDSEVADSFNITDINDYVHVQKQVISTLKSEGFFTNEGGTSTTVTNSESGMVVEVNVKGVKETFYQKNYGRTSKQLKIAKLATIRDIPKLIEKGTLISDDVENMHNSESGVSYAYIKSDVKINGKSATVRIVIRKSSQKNKFWVHMIDINNVDESVPAGVSEDSKTGYQASTDKGSVPQNEGKVKTKLEDRVSGDDLLNAQDLIEEIESVGGGERPRNRNATLGRHCG